MPDYAVKTAFTAQDRVTKAFGSMSRGADKFGNRSSRAFQKASRHGSGFLKKMMSFKTILAGASVALVARSIGKTIIKTAALGDEAAKTSRRLGITAEALQEIRFAADRQGVSNGVLNSSFTALQKRVGELRAGTGSLYTFMRKTGNEAFAKQLKGAKNTDEAFQILTKEINKIKNPMDRAALASAAFSRAGVDMLKFMEAGPDGIKKLRAEAQKYGAVIDNKAAAQSEIFVDAMTNMKSAMSGVGRTFSVMLVPSITKAMQKTADYIATNRDLTKAKIGKGIELIKEAYAAIVPIVKSAVNIFKKFLPILKAIAPIIPILVGGMIAYNMALKAQMAIGAIASFFKFIKLLKSASAAQGILNIAMTANPIGAIVMGITLLIAGIVLMVKHWDKVKIVFGKTMDFMKKAMFSFAHIYLSVWFGIIKKIIGGMKFVGKLLGRDTSGLDNALSAISKQQAAIKEKSFFADSQKSVVPPNRSEVEARQQVAFQGKLQIAGAPPGSSVESKTTGAPPIQMELLGA